jgi:Uncharacterized protein conserved in bacteria (DUF2087)
MARETPIVMQCNPTLRCAHGGDSDTGYVAGRFEPDRRYAEPEVNDMLMSLHDDHVSLRRYLVDEGLLDREAGVYRRA